MKVREDRYFPPIGPNKPIDVCWPSPLGRLAPVDRTLHFHSPTESLYRHPIEQNHQIAKGASTQTTTTSAKSIMMNNAFFRRGLATSSGAVAVTLASWCGESTASRTTSRVTTQAVERLQSSLANQTRSFSSAATKAETPKSFVQWYEGHLEARPILTKQVTGSILWGVGDAVAQVFPHLSSSSSSLDELEYDWMRTGRAVTFGGIIHAPTSHMHFNFLEWMTVRTGFTGLQIPIFKTFMEQVCIICG